MHINGPIVEYIAGKVRKTCPLEFAIVYYYYYSILLCCSYLAMLAAHLRYFYEIWIHQIDNVFLWVWIGLILVYF